VSEMRCGFERAEKRLDLQPVAPGRPRAATGECSIPYRELPEIATTLAGRWTRHDPGSVACGVRGPVRSPDEPG
jgi:hypothetical protein